jgi:casein kinase II subunit beta
VRFYHFAESLFYFYSPSGAFFGTTFPNLFFQTYRELAPAPYYSEANALWSPVRSPTDTPSTNAGQHSFTNPNPYGGQKQPAGNVYTPTIYGFQVSERARNGPRMRWLRLRPQTAAELDAVDWRGRWIGSEEEYDDDEEVAKGAPMEDFDPVSMLLA